ncbi:hypothetical protein ACFPER_10965 [Agromyces aurantiacus]|uniref:Signal transduction histidine kinase subgroup 3 dimerisation and phosphoacceptor domain-containing protein n=1 Tax=Agromyces aurantiacus TaxID=165814 RepID=A0ABV9R6Y7_9MICO|nr:hypothetical protein [Agromyces aurantiacus]MBM7503999.1 hypothetical protein [Agromyces aurantiacus]
MSGGMRLTQQEVDPIGGLAAAPMVVVGSALAVVVAVGVTAAQWAEVSAPVVAIVAVMLVVAAGVVASVSTLPRRAPFTVDRLWLTVSLAVAAAIAEYIATVGAPGGAGYDHFGPIVVGALVLAVAPYSTWVSLLVAGGIAAAILTILQIGSTGASLPRVVAVSIVILDAVTVLAFTAAAAGYSASIVRETLAWQRQANAAALERDAGIRTGIARSVQQSRVSVLGREVLPFLAHVMTADRITVADADRARVLAEALRRALKAGLESTWLDDLAASVAATRDVSVSVHDPGGIAGRLRSDQRPALTALLSWLTTGDRARAVRMSVDADGSGGVIVLDAEPGTAPPARREVERFLAVARSVGLRGDVVITRENVQVEFRYDLG